MITQHYKEVRQRTEQLCRPLTVEDTVPQYVDYASPPKWHLAHTTWFFEEMVLKTAVPDYQEFNPIFGQLFNSYYQTMGQLFTRSQRGVISRPGLAEVLAYRAHVDAQMHGLLTQEMPAELNELVELGLHHEQQHQELLITDLKLAFAQNPMFPVYDEGFDEGFKRNTQPAQWINIAAGQAEIGHRGTSFCFDNELAAHTVTLAAYQISDQLVSNQEYLEFIDAGGYQTFEYWLDEGWSWVQEQQIQSPMYWIKTDDTWHHFTLNGLQILPLNASVTHLSYYEANAFAAWRKCRLPTEFEWEAAAPLFDWGQRWEWTSSAYQPYPGFAVSAGAVGEYNGKFMVNQLVLRGASVATSPGHARLSYRNFFHAHHQWQYSGLRLAR